MPHLKTISTQSNSILGMTPVASYASESPYIWIDLILLFLPVCSSLTLGNLLSQLAVTPLWGLITQHILQVPQARALSLPSPTTVHLKWHPAGLDWPAFSSTRASSQSHSLQQPVSSYEGRSDYFLLVEQFPALLVIKFKDNELGLQDPVEPPGPSKALLHSFSWTVSQA